ncbi:Ferric reductase transmembrane component 3 [Ceratocystis fimbriata CBS 114723]|uniref:Ferric reductase transmembrane component 3 n=1 Tax=Ceratocystis fimbriata CBS 114723 TaxID=1035309 RepID=A0A2C5WZ57_9PEZI|nr:Ferric reductase transmembrane component 3 [Ceratocystis fimbriata CBS 114723]
MYWIAIICMGTGYRLFGNALTRRLSHPHPKTPGDETVDDIAFVPQPAGPASWLRRFILLPAVFGYRKAQPFGWYTVPPRAQSVALAIFVALNVWVTVQGYYFTDKNIYFPTRQKQLWRYLSDRSGFVSYANFPLVWVFGLRNNLLLWLTGWDFGTYNNFHRWVARVATAQAVIHSVGYTFFWWTGEIATIGMCLVLVASLYWVRRNIHLTIFKDRINSVFWLCSLVWAGDRLGRTMRILAFNPCFWSTHACVSYSPSANILLLSVSCRNSLYRPKPGTFYYIYALNSRCFWESHPFTVATISFATGEASCYEDCTAPLLDTPKPCKKPTEILFLIRPYGGFTERLKASALQGPRKMRILIEGPYGHSIPLGDFTTSLFIVGGSGIAVPLSYLTHLLAAKRSVRVVWAVREPAFVSDVIERDLARLLSSLGGSIDGLSLDIYVTSGEVCHAATPPGVTLFRGRPAVDMEVQETVAGVGAGRLAVVACGPGVMADDARAAVVKAIARGYTQTEYFEEAFNW